MLDNLVGVAMVELVPLYDDCIGVDEHALSNDIELMHSNINIFTFNLLLLQQR